MTTSAAVLDFIARLHGMDRLQRVDVTDPTPGAIDVLTGQVFEPAEDFPAGEKLVLERFNGERVLVHTHIVVEALIVRDAKARHAAEGGSVAAHINDLKEHLAIKTGFGA